jgi:CRP-like cAMP-binding protein
MPNGNRQILSFLLPGDIVGLFAPVATISTETVTALNQLTVAPFAFDDIISTPANAPLTFLDAP